MHKNSLIPRLLGIAIIALSGSCGISQTATTSDTKPLSSAASDCRTITHQQGKTEVCGQPQRIVVLGPYLLEDVLALGEQPAGFADHVALHQGDYDDPAQQIPYLGDRITTRPVNVGLAYQPSIEAILRVQPDLILSPDFNAAQYAALSKIAPTLILDTKKGQTNLSIIGEALNRTEQAADLLAATKRRIESAKAKFAAVVEQHPNLLLLASEDAQTFNLMSHTNSFCGSLLNDLGFHLIYPQGLDESALSTPTSVSLETLPQMNAADSIILFGFKWDAPTQNTTTFEAHQLNRLKQAWDKNAIAQSLKASQAKRVYFIPAYVCLGLPGPIGTELYLNDLEAQLLSLPQQMP